MPDLFARPIVAAAFAVLVSPFLTAQPCEAQVATTAHQSTSQLDFEPQALQSRPEWADDVTPEWTVDETPVRRFRKQAIQRVSVAGGMLAALDSNDLSTSHLEASVSLGVPLGSFENILGVRPSFRVDWIDSGVATDVPSQLFETGVQLFWRKPINDRWSFMAISRPSVRSDFHTSDNAFKVFALALLNWSYVPDQLSLSFGVVYLDRADIPLVPAIGLMWTPDKETRLDLRFPQSRYSKRIAKNGAMSETWAYMSAGLGGNTWAVTRSNGASDELSLRDIRLAVGIEHIVDGGGGWFIEAGYAFSRRLEFERADSEIELSDAIVVRAGVSF